MTEDAAAGYIPGAAESYHLSGDGLTNTFHIRDHCRSDDMPVTADDFVYSFRRVLNPKTAAQYASLLYPIANAEAVNARHASLEALGVRTLNARTLEIRFAIEVLDMEELLSHTRAYPVPRHVIAHHGDNSWTNPCVLIGNGPYKLNEWIPNEHVALEWNPCFYDATSVKIPRAVIHPTQDYAAALTRFRAGELDIDFFSERASGTIVGCAILLVMLCRPEFFRVVEGELQHVGEIAAPHLGARSRLRGKSCCSGYAAQTFARGQSRSERLAADARAPPWASCASAARTSRAADARECNRCT